MHGQLMTGTFVGESAPVVVFSGAAAIAAGDYHSLVLKADGTVWGGGLNGFGQLGTRAQTPDLPSPVQAQGINGATVLGTCVSEQLRRGHRRRPDLGVRLQPARTARGIGAVAEAQPSLAEVQLSGVTSVAGGEYHTFFSPADGWVWVSGSNFKPAPGVGYNDALEVHADARALTHPERDRRRREGFIHLCSDGLGIGGAGSSVAAARPHPMGPVR